LGERVRQRKVLHRMVRVAAGFRPLRIDHGRRQGDRDFRHVRIGLELPVEAENRNALARQRLLLVTEQTAPGEPERDQQQQRNDESDHWLPKAGGQKGGGRSCGT